MLFEQDPRSQQSDPQASRADCYFLIVDNLSSILWAAMMLAAD